MAVHARPAAFDGADGFAYSVDIVVDETGNSAAPWGASLFFVRWGAGEPEVTGHLETDFLATGRSEATVRLQVGAMPLASVKATLDGLIRTREAHRADNAPGSTPDQRPWWEVAATEDGESEHDGDRDAGENAS